ncbi:MAG: hypothetical protein AAGD13_00790 [Pseudomonadota bacterium]
MADPEEPNSVEAITDQVTDVAGAVQEVGKAAQEVGKAGPWSLLLGPSFKLIGEHWGEKVQAWLKPEEVANIEGHMDAVRNRLPPPGETELSPSLAAALMQWQDGVKGIEAKRTDAEAEAWREALVKAFEGNLELLHIMPQLDMDMVHALRHADLSITSARKDLIEIGLVTEEEDDYMSEWPVICALGGLIGFIILGILSIFIVSELIKSAIFTISMALIVSTVVIEFIFRKFFRPNNVKLYRFTKKGEYLSHLLGRNEPFFVPFRVKEK